MNETRAGVVVPVLGTPVITAPRSGQVHSFAPASSLRVLALSAFLAGTGACNRSGAPSSAGPTPVADSHGSSPVTNLQGPSPGASAAAEIAPAAAKVETASYAISIQPPKSCHRSAPCTADVVVVAKGDYHINDKYPYRFKVEDPAAEGVTYPEPTVGKEHATLEEKKATFPVPFVAASGGEVSVGGVLSLSVCSAAHCLIDKQAVGVAVKVDD